MLKICVYGRILTDKSTVYDVAMGDNVLHAVSLDDAKDMAEKIRRAIADHSCDDVKVHYGI